MPRKGTTTQRGYGTAHQKLRDQYEPLVRAGQATCWRCELPIAADAEWDLGHDDTDPTRRRYKGPEHPACNRATKGRRKPTPTTDTTRQW